MNKDLTIALFIALAITFFIWHVDLYHKRGHLHMSVHFSFCTALLSFGALSALEGLHITAMLLLALAFVAPHFMAKWFSSLQSKD